MKIDLPYSPITVECAADEDLSSVASRMRFNDVGSAAVLSCGMLVAIITERDLARAVADAVDPDRTLVGDYMTPDPATIRDDVDASVAARLMAERGVRHLPVVDRNGTLLGLASMRDILIELMSPATTRMSTEMALAR